MKNIIFLLCLWCLTNQLSLQAQQNFVSGSIVLLNGEKLEGQIDYRNSERNPESIRFRANEGASIETYAPIDIRSFSVAGELFVSKIVKVDKSERGKMDNIKATLVEDIVLDTVFLSTRVEGKANLYYLKDENYKTHFFIEKDTILEELVYRKYLKTPDEGKPYIASEEKFKGQLNYYFSDCTTTKAKISKLSYENKPMVKLFEKYNECVNADYLLFNQESYDSKVKINAVGGLVMTTLSFDAEIGFTVYPPADFGYSFLPIAAVAFDLVVPRNRNRWSFLNELSYKPYKLSTQYTVAENENDYSNVDMRFNLGYLKLTTAFKYRQPMNTSKLRPFIYLGMGNAMAIKTTNSIEIEKVFYSSVSTKEEDAIDPFRRYEQSYVFGLGVNIDKFNVDFRYEQGNGMSSFLNLQAKTKSFYVLVNYQLNK